MCVVALVAQAGLLLVHRRGGGGSLPAVHLSSAALIDGRGRPASIAAMSAGRPAIVNLWQSTCQPCLAEMPLLGAFSRAHPRIAVIGVGVLETARSLGRQARRTGSDYPLVIDPAGEFFASVGGVGVPLTLAVRPDGTISARRLGPFRTAADLDRWAQRHLR